MTKVIIKSCKDLLKTLKNQGNVFRGCSDSNYKLIPSIGRLDSYNLSLEFKTLNQFKSRINTTNQQDWEMLFLAQHYGVLTRLLDWTLDPLVALYFASRRKKEAKFVVYSLNASILETPPTDSPFKISETIFIKPTFTDSRIKNQKSIFSIQENCTELVSNSNLTAFIFEPELRKEVLTLCHSNGINDEYLLTNGLVNIKE